VRGVSGVICNDFMAGFEVLDADGEFSREVMKAVTLMHSSLNYVMFYTIFFKWISLYLSDDVSSFYTHTAMLIRFLFIYIFMSFQIPLLSASVVGFTSTTKSAHQGDENSSADISAVEELSLGIDGEAQSSGTAAGLDKDLMNTVDIRVECIDEERLGLGIGDYADVTLLDSNSDGMIAPPLGPYEVIRVDNSKSAVLRIRTLSDKWSEMADQILLKIKAGKATVKKVRSYQVVLIIKEWVCINQYLQ
jgi:hypothetical protein